MKGKRPDFNDAGYGQMGCALIGISAIGGWVVGVVGSWLAAAAGAVPSGLAPGDHAAVVVGGMALTLGATLAAMWVIDRVPRLWRRSDRILLGVWLAPGPVVALVIAAGLDLAVGPLAVAAAVALGFVVLELAGDLARTVRPRASTIGSQVHRDGLAASVFGGLLGNVAGTLSLSLIHVDWLLPEGADAATAALDLALGWGLALLAGVLAGRVSALLLARASERATLVVAAVTSGMVLWWLASVNT